MTFAAVITLPKTTHNISTFETSETLSWKNSRFLHINRFMETFLESNSRFIQDPGFKLAVEKETLSPRNPNTF